MLAEDELKALPGVVSVGRDADVWRLAVTAPHHALPPLLELVHGRAALTQLTTRQASLEDVFVTLTGRHLRDDA